MRRFSLSALVALGVLFTSVGSASAADFVVLLREGADAQREANRAGVASARLYPNVGAFVADLSPAGRAALNADADVWTVTANRTLHAEPDPRAQSESLPVEPFPAGQVVPTGVRRIGGLRSPTADIDGVDERVNVDVAILEDELDPDHRDLNVAGQVDCVGRRRSRPDWHAMHSAGVVGALDNGRGVVGVAPGARLWGVDIVDEDDATTLDWILCGIDWLIAHANRIEVTNFSAGFEGFDDPNCGRNPPDPVHAGICRSVKRGMTWAVSAGNEATDASGTVPAAFEQVIAVSALADYDGRPGGKSEQTCLGGVFDLGADDTFAVYSNFGADVDLMAPGNCILSTSARDAVAAVDAVTNVYRDRSDFYAISNGTSFSAPHVAGAAALYLAAHPGMSPAGVLNALQANRERGPVPGDPDGINEGIVNVAGF
jgi:subtilisin